MVPSVQSTDLPPLLTEIKQILAKKSEEAKKLGEKTVGQAKDAKK